MSNEKREFIIDRLKMEVVYKGSLADLFKSFTNINKTIKSIEIAVDRYCEDNKEFSVSHFMEWLTGQLEECGHLIEAEEYRDISPREQMKYKWFDELEKYLYIGFSNEYLKQKENSYTHSKKVYALWGRNNELYELLSEVGHKFRMKNIKNGQIETVDKKELTVVNNL